MLCVAAAAQVVTIDTARRFQTIEGFGATGSWWAQDVGGWDESKLDQICAGLFSANGAHLSIYRFHIGAGGGKEIRDRWRRAETFEVAPGEYDFTRDANARRMLRKVVDAGVTNIEFISYSPPERLTISGMVSGGPDGGANLAREYVDEYARYMVDIVEHFYREERIPITGLSPLNEPDVRWGGKRRSQEGMHMSPNEAARLIGATHRELKRRGLPIKVVAPEGGKWDTWPYVEAMFRDSELRREIDAVAVHSYWSKTENRRAFARRMARHFPQKRVRMTEWCEMEHGHNNDIDSAMVMARTIHEDLTIGNASAWIFWLAVSQYDYADGLFYVKRNSKELSWSRRLPTIGQYSRYARPGYTRVGCESSDGNLLASAYVSPEGDRTVLVLVNTSRFKRSVTVRADANQPGAQVEAHTTTARLNLTKIHDGKTFPTYNLEAQSITTLIWSE